MNLLVITPHLSTGGCPQYLLEYLKYNRFQYTNIKVIEFSNFSNEYIVQKNKIKSLIGFENVTCLGDFWVSDEQFKSDKLKLLDIISSYKPDVIWFNEFPECFEYKLPPKELMVQIYNENRSYKIIETTHNNSFDFNCKIYLPDEFMFCSELHIEKSKNLNIKNTVWEIPIGDNIRPDRRSVLESLGLDPSYLHVLNVGIINQNKNQKYIFELAEQLKFYKVKFHFIGNTCFLNDCGIPVDHLKQDNCIMWGERSDVDVFMSCMDLFLFPSHKELNPLSVKEALSWNMDVVCKKCDNYTYKYLGKSNFHLLEDLNIKNYIIDKLKYISALNKNEKKYKNFALYTSFYNCSKYVNQIFDQISKINYKNFTWFVTDDFSADDTKFLIEENIKKYDCIKIHYINQDFKKQLYWKPNYFINNDYDYIVLIDADDFFDFNFLKIYNEVLSSDESIYLLTSDFKKINEINNSLHSLSLVYNDKPLKSKINDYHPQVNYLNNLNYYCFGTLRCFKNVSQINFEINNYKACAEDSYRCMSVNSYGKWLHLPRNLYTWNIREFSESHGPMQEGFNDNFRIAYEKLLNSESLIDLKYKNLYKETCALNFIDINSKESISIFTKNNETSLLKGLFFDKNFSINNLESHDVYVLILNYFNENEIKDTLDNISNKQAKIICYYLLDEDFKTSAELDKTIINNKYKLSQKLSELFNVESYYSYIRHNYFCCYIDYKNRQSNANKHNTSVIDVFSFDSDNLKLEYKLSQGDEGYYDIEVYENTYNLCLYKEKLLLSKKYSYWTNFEYCKDLIEKDVSVIFKKNSTVIFDKKYNINISAQRKKIALRNIDFQREVDGISYYEVFIKNQYDKFGITVEKNDVVVDIGANVGAFINFAITKECKKIYACEPNKNCLAIIDKYYSNICDLVINDCAISDKTGHSYLKLDFQNSTPLNAALVEAEAFAPIETGKEKVKINTFKNFILENKIECIDFLKIDCEGGENFIFVDENKQYFKTNVKKIAVEYHNSYKDSIKNYLIDLGFVVYEDVHRENLGFFYAEKKVTIINESGSLGDAIAWVPIVNEFAKQKNKKVNLYTPHKNLFQGKYNLINFFDYAEKPTVNNGETYNLGCFDNMNWKKYSLQEIACIILGIDYKQCKPEINLPKITNKSYAKKYVCIATQSTSQCKYWNNEKGWIQTIDYLKSLDYDVICIDKYSSYGNKQKMNQIPYNCINDTGDKPLEDRIETLVNCEFFIGLGSGLSWLAWACNKPVIMISGFSDPKSEFYTPYRVHNKNVCNSCWNDDSLSFDKNNWMWCPRNKNFECSKEITFEMVKEKIDICLQDLTEKKMSKKNKKKCFVTFVDGEKYEKLGLLLKDSIELHSDYKLITYKQNDIDNSYSFQDSCNVSLGAASKGFANKILCCLKALETYDEVVWIDCDCVVTSNIDKIWFESYRLKNYPLLPHARFSNFDEEAIPQKKYTFINKEALDYFSIKDSCSEYLQACFMYFNKNSTDFFKKVLSFFDANYCSKTFQFADETIINCLLQKNEFNDNLGSCFLCSYYFNDLLYSYLEATGKKEFYNLFDSFKIKDNNFSEILFLHGSKDILLHQNYLNIMKNNKQ